MRVTSCIITKNSRSGGGQQPSSTAKAPCPLPCESLLFAHLIPLKTRMAAPDGHCRAAGGWLGFPLSRRKQPMSIAKQIFQFDTATIAGIDIQNHSCPIHHYVKPRLI